MLLPAFAVPAPPGPPPVPFVRSIRESCWQVARETLLANPHIEHTETFCTHGCEGWRYFLFRTPNGFYRRTYFNNNLVDNTRDYPL